MDVYTLGTGYRFNKVFMQNETYTINCDRLNTEINDISKARHSKL